MRDNDIGDVLVTLDGKVAGLVTDRDLVVRVLAGGGSVHHSRADGDLPAS
jgi:CBS domain-containing protein